MSASEFVGKQAWRCSACRSVVLSDATWRWAGDYPEHRCAGTHPQAGHWLPELEPVDSIQASAIVGIRASLYAMNLDRRIVAAEEHDRTERAGQRKLERDRIDQLIDSLPADVDHVLRVMKPLMEFEGGQVGWMVRSEHIEPRLFVEALYAGMFTEEGEGLYNDDAYHLLRLADPVSRVQHVWYRCVPQGPCVGSMYYDAVPHSRGAFMATVLEW